MGSKTITGYAHLKYTRAIKANNLLKLGFQTQRFSYLAYSENLNYNKVEPFVSLQVKNITKNKHQAQIGFKTSLVLLDYLYKGKQQEFYYVNHLSVKYDFNKTKDNFITQIDLKQGSNFVSLSGELNAIINYPTKKYNAFYARLFVGGFFYLVETLQAPDVEFLLTANNRPYLGSGNSAHTQLQEDYNFRNFFLDRNSQDPFFSRQVGTNSDGGFKSLAKIGVINKYLAALNLSSDIPIPIPIEPWANFAIIEVANKPEPTVEFGASLNLMDKFIQFHFPFISTHNIAPTSFGENISFSLNLLKLDKLRKY